MKLEIMRIIKYGSAILLMTLYGMVTCLLYRNMQLLNIYTRSAGGRGYVVISIFYCIFLFVLLYTFEAFQIGRRRIMDLLFGHFLSAVCVNLIFLFFLCMITPLPLKELLVSGILLFFLEIFGGLAWVMFCHRFYEKYQFCKAALFIYGNREDATEYVRINNTINQYFKISNAIDYAVGLKQVFLMMEDARVVFLGDIPTEVRNSIMKQCLQKKKECYSVPKISDIYIQNTKVLQLRDKILFQYRETGISNEKKVVKRLMDVVISLVMLILFSPVMLVIAIMIKAEDGGSIIYRQDRVTENGREFQMLKFRSMREDAEKDGARMAGKDDDRITKVGKRIRNIHFDELPQLVNVLKGEMSMVGPRPERKEFTEEYCQKIPEFSERLKVKGGLTGYAQVYGKYNSWAEDKLKYDLLYIYNYSLRLDLKILILTFRILFQKENTEGIDENQISESGRQYSREEAKK